MVVLNQRERVCCNCGNNIRVKDDRGMVEHTECVIDGHYIGYIQCFEGWCRRWRKERLIDEDPEGSLRRRQMDIAHGAKGEKANFEHEDDENLHKWLE